MARYAIWNKQDPILTPVGEVLTAGQWMDRYPVARLENITIVCGGGLIAGGIMRHFLPEHIWSIPLLAAIILGLAFMLYAQIKYNRGIF